MGLIYINILYIKDQKYLQIAWLNFGYFLTPLPSLHNGALKTSWLFHIFVEKKFVSTFQEVEWYKKTLNNQGVMLEQGLAIVYPLSTAPITAQYSHTWQFKNP